MELLFLLAVLTMGFAVAFVLAGGVLTLVFSAMAPTNRAVRRRPFGDREQNRPISVFQS